MKLEILAPIRNLQDASLRWLASVDNIMKTAPYSYGFRVVYQEASQSSAPETPHFSSPLALEKEKEALGIYGAINQAIDHTSGSCFLILGEGDTLTNYPKLNSESDIYFGSNIPMEDRIRFRLSEVCQQNVIYNTTWFRGKGLRFNTQLRANADHFLHMQMMRFTPRITRIPSFSKYAGNGFSEHHADRLYHAALPSLRRYHLGLPAMLSTLVLRGQRWILGRRQRYLSLAKESRVAIIVISNRPHHLHTCLTALARVISKAGWRHNITQIQVICDDHGKIQWDIERLTCIIEECGFSTFIHRSSLIENASIKPGTERSSLRNIAAGLAKHKDPFLSHFFFLDGDIELSPQTFGAIHNNLHVPWACISFACLPRRRSGNIGFALLIASFVYYYILCAKRLGIQICRVAGWLPLPQKLYAPTLSSGQLLISTDAFDAVQGFKPIIEGWGGEDLALGYRLYQQGIYPIMPTMPLWPSRHHWHPTLPPAEKRHINQKCVAILREDYDLIEKYRAGAK